MGPSVFADTLERAPQLPTVSSTLARVRNAGRSAVFDDFRQVDRHEAVDVQYLAIDHQTTETADQALLDGVLFGDFTEEYLGSLGEITGNKTQHCFCPAQLDSSVIIS